MKRSIRRKLIEGHDNFFMQMGQSSNLGEAAGEQADNLDTQTEKLHASWLEYNARHGKRMRRRPGIKRNGKRS